MVYLVRPPFKNKIHKKQGQLKKYIKMIRECPAQIRLGSVFPAPPLNSSYNLLAGRNFGAQLADFP